MAHGDPATQEWRQALAGTAVTNSWDTASTSAALRQTQAALAASQADLTSMQEQRDRFIKAADKLHGEWLDLKADLTRAKQDLAEALEMNAALAVELATVSHRLTRAEKRDSCAWRGLAVDLMRERESAESDTACATADTEKEA